MEFRILGPLEVLGEGAPLPLGGAKQRALLALLLLEANRVVAKDRLIDALWGGAAPKTASAALQVHVSQLRKALDDTREGQPPVLVTRPPGYLVRVEKDELDLQRFERLVVDARTALDDDPATASAKLGEALSLWRGRPLADLAGAASLLGETERLEELRVAALEDRIEADLALGRHAQLVGELEALAVTYPLRERLRSQLILALYRSGRQAEALAAYQKARHDLVEELGIEPGPALQRLEKAVLQQDPSLELTSVQGAPATAAEPAAPPGTPEAWPEDETRPLTILFADMSASVTATYELDPEETTDLLNVVLTEMVQAVEKRGGRVNSLLGDGVLAFFGTPEAHEDDPERAIRAAIHIRAALQARGLNGTAGIDTGEVYLGRVGPEEHQEFAARGRVINLAARLQAKAAPGQVLVGEVTQRLARGSFEFSPVTLEIKGLATPVRAYEVHRAVSKPEKARGIEGLRADLHGRVEELARLKRALADVLAGAGHAVFLVGEPGVGKSRLVSELRAAAEAVPERSPRWLEGRCLESGTATSYLPFIAILHDYFGLLPDEADEVGEERIASALQELAEAGHLVDERANEIAPLLEKLLSIRTARGGHAVASLTPEQVRNQTFAAVRDLLVALARERPLVVVLEDVHWADALTVGLTSLLVESAREEAVLVLCVSRLEPEDNLRRLSALAARKIDDAYEEVRLRELGSSETRSLLDALLPIEDLPEKAEALILDRSQGNPFFLEEVLRSLIDAGVVYRANGGWRAREEIESLTLPDSVHSVIKSRFDRLDDELKRMLQTAAVIGRSFPRRLLEELTDGPSALDDPLRALEARDLVYLDRVVPEEEYSFKHVLTQEAIYRGILRRKLTDLHERTAEAMERVYADALEEHYEQLAYHYERGTDSQKAIDYLAAAGEKSRRAFLNEEALEYFERALVRFEQDDVAASGWDADLLAKILESRGDVLQLGGKHEEAIASYERVLADAQARDAVGRARLHRKIALSYHVERKMDEAHRALDRAESALADEPREDAAEWWNERCEIELERFWLYYFFGSLDEQVDALDAQGGLIERRGTAVQRSQLLSLRASALWRRERLVPTDDVFALLRSAVSVAEESADVAALASAQFEYAFAVLWGSPPEEGEAELRRALSLAERIGDVTLQARILPYLTLAVRKRGRVEDVRALATRALDAADTAQMNEYKLQANANLAWAAFRTGDAASAERYTAAALELWQPLRDSVYVALQWIWTWPFIALALAQDRFPDAIESVRALLDPACQPMPPDLHAVLEDVIASWEADEPEIAREKLDAASAIATRYGYL